MLKQKRRSRPVAESLEKRRLLTSTSILLSYDFNANNPWPGMSGTATSGATASAAYGAYGTIDTEGGTTPTGGLQLIASPPSSGYWTSDLNSGELAVSNSITNLGLLTLNFTLEVSQAVPVKLRVFSYANSTGSPSGGLETILYPAASNYNQHFAVDLSSFSKSGAGTFNPAAPYISFSFEMNSVLGWSAASTPKLSIDNVNYSKPAYYVSPTGSNSSNGLTTTTAFASPAKAVSVSQPGDIIDVMGTAATPYMITDTNVNNIHFAAGGTPAAWVTLKNYPGQSPEIHSEWWNAILIGNGNSTTKATTAAVAYINIRGLHLHGNADIAQTEYPSSIGQSNPQTNGNGISVDGRFETNHPHDFLFNNNFIEYFCGGGCGGEECDRIDIENNVIQNTSWWTIYASSGVSILSDYNFDGTTNSYTRIVRDNSCSGSITNEESDEGVWSDGNGIIIDLNVDTGYLLSTSACKGRTLVEDNISFNNGGSGIHAFESNHVDIINNVAYYNGVSPYNGLPKAVSHYSQIFADTFGAFSNPDINIYNNILVAPVAPNGSAAYPVNNSNNASGSFSESASFYHDNLYYGGNTAPLMGTGDRFLDPQFVNPTTNPTTANFELQSTSPAINAGTTTLAPLVDFLNNVRNGVPDIGAYEYYSSTPTIVTAASAVPTPVTGITTNLSVLAADSNGPTALSYTWAATAYPTGASPSFDPNNGTNVTYTSAVSFSRAGSYTFTVTVTDANANSTTSTVSVVVNQTVSSITLSPVSGTIAGGTTQQYSANVYDQFGNFASPTLSWGATGGTITSSGLFTAGQSGGNFSITATSSGVTGTATVSVVPTVYTTAGAGYYIELASDGSTEQIWVGAPGSVGPMFGLATYSIPLYTLPSLTFGPATGSEALTIDLANGKPIPTGGLTFNGGAGTDALTILGTGGNDSVTVNATQVFLGTTPVAYANIESIAVNLGAGSDTLTQSAQPGNGATLTLINPTSADSLIVAGGTFTLPPSTSGITKVSLGSVNVSSGAEVAMTASTPHTTRLLLAVGTLTLPATALLDLGGNDLIVSKAASNLVADAYAGLTAGIGLITSAPLGNNLRSVGLIVSTGQSFDGQATNSGDTLIKTTYFGDANFDGIVDGSDYTKIDSGYHSGATGWSNGDFNYDGVIDGSDYTLIDNAFNTQGAQLSAAIANAVATKSANVAVPLIQTPSSEVNKTQKKSIALAQSIEFMSSELHVTKQAPPCFLSHGADDHIVAAQNSMDFANALAQNGVPFELHIYQHGPHGMGLGIHGYDPYTSDPAQLRCWTTEMANWLKLQKFAK